MKLNIKNSLLAIVGLSILFFASCKKVEHGIDEQVVSINQGTTSIIQVGKPLKVGFISNMVSDFEFAVVKDSSSSEALFTEQVNLEGNKIVEKEFDLKSNDTWVGDALLKITYQANGQTVSKFKAITFTESNPVMYIVGGSIGAGWSPELSVAMKLQNADSKTKFEIYEYIDVTGGGFKFLPTNINWDGAFGKGAAAGSLLQDGGAGNLEAASSGFYRIRMDAEALTYELLKTSWAIVGSATPGGWEADTDMSFSNSKGTYVWKVKANLAAGELKFRANDAWDINLGGSLTELTQDGPNLAIAAPGVYDIELSLHPSGYTAKITKN
ncbi:MULTISPECIES: SusF/SusE family outer membrane protein [Sphingobacterium]|uniref:SusF/SusE family outer membrane protein n=1 Tax=Sphingobacterium tenebrionis TaxID=3111775 RepID=A0ABU8I7G5_9SPHI|nr:SusF/SusE family outer membrane protein [Sphingobacterium sp. CZ-2]QBR12120.1 SusF/SusE family outer membrane protein [Sphingobacterium sp. CZ-2]